VARFDPGAARLATLLETRQGFGENRRLPPRRTIGQARIPKFDHGSGEWNHWRKSKVELEISTAME